MVFHKIGNFLSSGLKALGGFSHHLKNLGGHVGKSLGGLFTEGVSKLGGLVQRHTGSEHLGNMAKAFIEHKGKELAHKAVDWGADKIGGIGNEHLRKAAHEGFSGFKNNLGDVLGKRRAEGDLGDSTEKRRGIAVGAQQMGGGGGDQQSLVGKMSSNLGFLKAM